MAASSDFDVAVLGRLDAFGDREWAVVGDLEEHGDECGHLVGGVEGGVDAVTSGVDERRAGWVGALNAVAGQHVGQLTLGHVDEDGPGVGVPRELGAWLGGDLGDDRS